MNIRTVIVDDEPLARERLGKLLREESDIEIIARCGNGREAISVIKAQKPELVFLDIQMPELDGFGVVSELQGLVSPTFIFVTAHDRFALRAFEVHALDYLLKPFDRERFQTALDRARRQIREAQSGALNERLSTLLADIKEARARPKYADRVAVKSDGRVLFFRTDEIDWVEAADNYVNLHIGNDAYLHRETLTSLEGALPPQKFLRISRSTIVNVERIKELQPMFHGDYVVILRNGTRLTLSRNYREKLNHLLGKDDK
jgi:two-component system LytT family response regulator